MKRPRIKQLTFSIQAFEDIRRSKEVNDALQGIVDKVLQKVEGGHAEYGSGVEDGKSRSRGYVVTANGQAMRDEAYDQKLLRALDGVVENG